MEAFRINGSLMTTRECLRVWNSISILLYKISDLDVLWNYSDWGTLCRNRRYMEDCVVPTRSWWMMLHFLFTLVCFDNENVFNKKSINQQRDCYRFIQYFTDSVAHKWKFQWDAFYNHFSMRNFINICFCIH